MKQAALETVVKKGLSDFYDARLNGLSKLKLRDVLGKKNPYLYRALGVEKASEIVEQVLGAFVTSSDETIFGNVFFEPIARIASGGQVAGGEGVDFVVESETRFLAVAVKSGPNWANGDQKKRQSENFDALRKRLYKIQKQFDPLCGQSYGRHRGQPSQSSRFRTLSGQAFWQEITGETDFYLRIIQAMRDFPAENRPIFKPAWDAAVNRFTGEFIADFCTPNGAIIWERLTQFSCGVERGALPSQTGKAAQKTKTKRKT